MLGLRSPNTRLIILDEAKAIERTETLIADLERKRRRSFDRIAGYLRTRHVLLRSLAPAGEDVSLAAEPRMRINLADENRYIQRQWRQWQAARPAPLVEGASARRGVSAGIKGTGGALP